MTKEGKGFSISQNHATEVCKQLHTGSGIGSRAEKVDRDILKHQLGIDRVNTSSPEHAIIGQLLIAYVTTSTRLMGILEEKSQEDIIDSINKRLSLPSGATPQNTFEVLLEMATNNSGLLNEH